jgi:hypothetical protein
VPGVFDEMSADLDPVPGRADPMPHDTNAVSGCVDLVPSCAEQVPGRADAVSAGLWSGADVCGGCGTLSGTGCRLSIVCGGEILNRFA